MEENLEIYFCEICSESIPARDIEIGDAVQLKDKVIGPCCLPGVRGPQAKVGSSTPGLTALGAILLAAIAGATVHLEWRLSNEVAMLEDKIGGVETAASSSAEVWPRFEKQLEGTTQKGALEPVLQRIQKLEGKLIESQESLRPEIRGVALRFEGLEETQAKIVAGQAEIRRDVKEVENGILRLERDVAVAAAAPRRRTEDAGIGEAVVRVVPEAAPGLPPALAHQVALLKDGDAGNRFEAVDRLVQSKNPLVLPHILPLLKDPDAFVRRLTAEGIASFRDKTSVDALLVALADPEDIVRLTAHRSLAKLTGQSIAFDPNGSASARSKGQRRWKEWWSKNRASF